MKNAMRFFEQYKMLRFNFYSTIVLFLNMVFCSKLCVIYLTQKSKCFCNLPVKSIFGDNRLNYGEYCRHNTHQLAKHHCISKYILWITQCFDMFITCFSISNPRWVHEFSIYISHDPTFFETIIHCLKNTSSDSCVHLGKNSRKKALWLQSTITKTFRNSVVDQWNHVS